MKLNNEEIIKFGTEEYYSLKEKFENVFKYINKNIYFVEDFEQLRFFNVILSMSYEEKYIENFNYTYMQFLDHHVLEKFSRYDIIEYCMTKETDEIRNLLNEKMDDRMVLFINQYSYYCKFYILIKMMSVKNSHLYFEPLLLPRDSMFRMMDFKSLPSSDDKYDSYILRSRYLSKLMIIDYLTENENIYENLMYRLLTRYEDIDNLNIEDYFSSFLLSLYMIEKTESEINKIVNIKFISTLMEDMKHPEFNYYSNSSRSMSKGTEWFMYLRNAYKENKGLYMSDFVDMIRYNIINEVINESRESLSIIDYPMYTILDDADKVYKEVKNSIKDKDKLIISKDTIKRYIEDYNFFNSVEPYYYKLNIYNMTKINEIYNHKDSVMEEFDKYINNEYSLTKKLPFNKILSLHMNELDISYEKYTQTLEDNLKIRNKLVNLKLDRNKDSRQIVKELFLSKEFIGIDLNEKEKEIILDLLIVNNISNKVRYGSSDMKEAYDGYIINANEGNIFNEVFSRIESKNLLIDISPEEIENISMTLNKLSELSFIGIVSYKEFISETKRLSEDTFRSLCYNNINNYNPDIRKYKYAQTYQDKSNEIYRVMYDYFNLDVWKELNAFTRIYKDYLKNSINTRGNNLPLDKIYSDVKYDMNDYDTLINHLDDYEELAAFMKMISLMFSSTSICRYDSIMQPIDQSISNMFPVSSGSLINYDIEEEIDYSNDSEYFCNISNLLTYVKNCDFKGIRMYDRNIKKYRILTKEEIDTYFYSLPNIQRSIEILNDKLETELVSQEINSLFE